MDNTELIERVHQLEQGQALHGEKIEVANHRIEDIESEVKENRELTIAVKEIATEMKHLREEQAVMREEQSKMNARLQTIEEKPAKNWDKVITTIIGTVIGAIAGAFIGLILK